jgi:hypothetical protein
VVTFVERSEGRVHATVPRRSSNPEPFHVDMLGGQWFCTCWKNQPGRACRHVRAVQETLRTEGGQ